MQDVLKGISPATIFARPEADSIWRGAAQEGALRLLAGEAHTKAIIGPRSSGRSTILQSLPTELADDVVLSVAGPKPDARSVLASALLDAQLAPWKLEETDQRNLLAVFVRQRVSQGHRVIVTIDNAELLGDDAWEEIERWRAWEEDEQALIELAISASPGGNHASNALVSSLSPSAVYELEPPSEPEIAEYLNWHLSRFDLEELFTHTAIREIANCAAGHFRAVNVLAQMALVVMRQRGVNRVDAGLVQEASLALARHRRPAADEDTGAAPQSTPHEPPTAQVLVSQEGGIIASTALGERLLIGRSEHNDLCLPSPYLSRHHAAIIGTTEGYYIVDLNSANGLKVNNNITGRALLYDQDVLSIGPYRLKIQISDGATPGYPLPNSASLNETALMPAPTDSKPPVRIVQG